MMEHLHSCQADRLSQLSRPRRACAASRQSPIVASRREKWGAWASFAWLLLLWTPLALHADGLYLNGVSPRTIGRGGTNLAHSDNAAIILDNPAAMTNIRGTQLGEIGVDILFTSFEYEDPFTGGTAKSHDVAALPQIGYIRRSEDGRWAYGLGIFTPAGFSESYRMEATAPFQGPQRYESYGALTKILPSLAWAPTDRLSVGATLGVGLSQVEFESPYFLQSPGQLQGTPMSIAMHGDGAALIWSAGMQYQLTDRTVIGATYQSESSFRLDGRATVEIPMLPAARYDSDIRLTWPQSAGFGLKHDLGQRGIFSADLLWYDWSGAFDDLAISLRNANLADFPDIDESLPLRWRDSLSVRLGHEIPLGNNRILRFGYVYHRNPIPSSTITPLIQAISEHAGAVGYGFRFRDFEIDLSYMVLLGKDVHVGTSQLIGGDFDNSRHGALIHALSIGAIRRF